MLDSSSSEEDDGDGGFSGYGSRPVGPTPQNVSAKLHSCRTSVSPSAQHSTSHGGYRHTVDLDEQSSRGSKRANGSAGGAAVMSRQTSTPYRNVPPRETCQITARDGSRYSSSFKGYDSVDGSPASRHVSHQPTRTSKLSSQHSVPETEEVDMSSSTASLNAAAPPFNQTATATGTRGSSSYSVNSTSSSPYLDQKISNSPSAASQNQEEMAVSHPQHQQQPTLSKDPAALELEKNEREEQERRRLLQLYVFVVRCIAYPFYSKPPTDLVRRYLKITKQQLTTFKERFQAYLNGELDVVGDEAFTNAIQSYYEIFLRSDRVSSMVRGGGCSMHDFREVFRLNSEHRVRCLPQIEGLNKSNVVSAWMVKFDQICRGGAGPSTVLQKLQVPQPELVMSKEQLYELFQSTLGVKKYEHQILYNALQLDNADEQAAQVRRELDGQLQMVEELSRSRQYPRLVVKEMESLYLEELKKMVGELMLRLEAVPVTKGSSSFQKFKKHSRGQGSTGPSSTASLYRDLSEEPAEVNLKNKLDIQLNFTLEIVVGQVRNLKYLPANKMVYCTMEVEGCEKLQTDLAEAGKPYWGTQGDFTTTQPLPTVKVKLYAESSGILSLDSGRELGRVVVNPTCTGNRQPEWHKLQTAKGVPDDLGIQLTIRMDKPTNLKYCGYLYALGRTAFKKWRRRYVCLIQVSQYTFIMASYKERKSDPLEIMQLEGFTVDFCDVQPDLAANGGKFFFNLVKEGDSVTFASDDSNERQLWIQAIYRATGQTHKPIPPSKEGPAMSSSHASSGLSSTGSRPGLGNRTQGDVDRARKHGLDEFVSVESWRINHAQLFRLLQSRSLEQRMKDPYVSLGWFSPSQMFILDEYCARYGVRGCHRHLCYLSDLLDRAEQGIMIDPALVHYSYAFCCCHVFGNAQDSNVRTVLHEERELFLEIRQRLYALLEKQITEFRYYFPFGRPEGALKLTLSLLERKPTEPVEHNLKHRFPVHEIPVFLALDGVLMKDTGAPASAEEVREVIRRCLEQAALVNYTRISEYAAIESTFQFCIS
ncbi:PH domain protein [Opisthorchis viverrini]|uniref:PH domain protein n=1 Tax=Opisthorchis viverrini TaxID=6198 RepID=A0A1S8X124_OPIVI|nr:PH domain protein [Opisthorchis viverrini]